MPLDSPRGLITYATTDHDYVASKEDLDANHNPFPSTNPKHAEFQRAARAAAVERLGVNASKLMRLSDFKAEEFHHDVAAAHRHEAVTRREREMAIAAAGGDVSPNRQRYAPATVGGFRDPEGPLAVFIPTPAPAVGSNLGGSPLTSQATSKKLTINDEPDTPASPDSARVGPPLDATQPQHSNTTTKVAAAITCSAALHGGHSILYGTADGALHLAHVQTAATAAHTATTSEATSLQFVDDIVRDKITTDQAHVDGVMGREEQCDSGVWVSKRFHRSVRAAAAVPVSTTSSAIATSDDGDNTNNVPPYALCMSLAPREAYAAVGMSDGSLQIWNYLTMEGVATLAPPSPVNGAIDNSVEAVVSIRFLSMMDVAVDTNMDASTLSQPTRPRGSYGLLLLYSKGTVALATFVVGKGTSALPPPYHGAMLSTTVSPTVQDAPHPFPVDDAANGVTPSVDVIVLRRGLIRGTVVPNSLCVSLDDNTAYVANKEGEWFVVDLADVQLAMRWSLNEFLSKCDNRISSTVTAAKKTVSNGSGANGLATPTKAGSHSKPSLQAQSPFALRGHTQQRPRAVTILNDDTNTDAVPASPAAVVYITSIDAHDTWIVLSMSSGEAVLLQRTKGRLSRSVYAIRQHIDLLQGKPSQSTGVVLLSRICPNSNSIVTLMEGSEIVQWSLSAELQFTILQRSTLPATGGLPSNLSVSVLTDAMEVWSSGADGINYAWVSQFPRTLHEAQATQLEADAIAEANGVALIDWHVVVSRMGAESQLGVQAATNALCRASEADVFRRYFWKWLQFRLEHQLQRKHETFAAILARSEHQLMGRDAFRKWVTFRNNRLRQKRNVNTSAALEALIRQQQMHGALTLWQRYRVHRHRQRECASRVVILLQATQRRQCAVAYSRLRAYARLQRLRRRWELFSTTLERETSKSLQRSMLMRWWGYRQSKMEHSHRLAIAESLAKDVAERQLAQTTILTWKSFVELRKRREVLRSWSETLGLNSTALVCSQYFHTWMKLAYRRRGEASEAKLAAATTHAELLETNITSAAPKVQRLRRVANLKERLGMCRDRMNELGEVQDGIATRVTMLRVAERHGAEHQNRRPSVNRCGSPLFAGVAAPPTVLEPRDPLDASRRSNHSAAAARNGLDDTIASVDGRSHRDEEPHTPVARRVSAEVEEGGSPVHVENSATEMFPQSLARLKKRILNLATDENLIVQTVEKARGAGTGSFTGSASGTPAKKLFLLTVQHIEKRVRDAFASSSTTALDRSVSGTSRTSGGGAEVGERDGTPAGSPSDTINDVDRSGSSPPPVDIWVPEDATEVELRAAMIKLAEKHPNIARGLLKDILSLVIIFDCMTPTERRGGIPERTRAALVHHTEVLDIIHDALLRSGISLQNQ